VKTEFGSNYRIEFFYGGIYPRQWEVRQMSEQRAIRAGKTEGYWQAVLARDAQFESAFVYAVRSTGVYCRPTCASRRPSRQQVAFYSSPEAAEQAGFRPCRRCRPRWEVPDSRSAQTKLVEHLCREIEASLDEGDGSITLATLSQRVGANAYRVQRSFKRVMGITPRQYADAQRLARLKSRLREGQDVTGALYDAGYGSSRALYERAPSRMGMTPATYRKGGRGMRVGYTIADSPLGRLLVGATERGVCAVCLGDSDKALETSLFAEYPQAEIHRDDATLCPWITAFLRHLQGRTPHLDLPVDVRATAFQWRVWEELRAIPYGTTRSYSDVARAIGRPEAIRAVAHACATNPVAVVIPCHRVVGKDGGLHGYRWGLERKQGLLALERRVTENPPAPAAKSRTGGAG
jgi:AraC family transcriptional regulator, regulatory protein of adaptative response / methylated-DNA-[protein]-cysteine methyltransferase